MFPVLLTVLQEVEKVLFLSLILFSHLGFLSNISQIRRGIGHIWDLGHNQRWWKIPHIHGVTAGTTLAPAASVSLWIISRHCEKHRLLGLTENTSLSTSFQLETFLAIAPFCLTLLGQIYTQTLILNPTPVLLPPALNLWCSSLLKISVYCIHWISLVHSGSQLLREHQQISWVWPPTTSSDISLAFTEHYFSRCSPTTSLKVSSKNFPE